MFALPSLTEGSPRVICEALGHSLPAVAAPAGDIAELLGDGTCGVFVLMRDPPALAAGIARLIDDIAFRRQCIRGGHACARQHALETHVARMARKARELVEGARRSWQTC
jgi:glycosyltransferase involved in cell wall biosynthesis